METDIQVLEYLKLAQSNEPYDCEDKEKILYLCEYISLSSFITDLKKYVNLAMSFSSENTHQEENHGMFIVWFVKKLIAILKWNLKI